jgi:hypothetical protein
LFLCDLERSTGSLADLVQFVLQGIELALHFLKGCAFRSDEQASILAPDVSQKGNPDGSRGVGSAGLDIEFKGSEDMHGYRSLSEFLPRKLSDDGT